MPQKGSFIERDAGIDEQRVEVHFVRRSFGVASTSTFRNLRLNRLHPERLSRAVQPLS